MDLARALDIVVGRTGVGRYRQLCDPDHRDYNPAYIPWVMREAGSPPPECEESTPARPSPIPVSESLARLAAMKACPHWTKSSDCGCSNNRCALGRGAAGVVSHADCFACLAASLLRGPTD